MRIKLLGIFLSLFFFAGQQVYAQALVDLYPTESPCKGGGCCTLLHSGTCEVFRCDMDPNVSAVYDDYCIVVCSRSQVTIVDLYNPENPDAGDPCARAIIANGGHVKKH